MWRVFLLVLSVGWCPYLSLWGYKEIFHRSSPSPELGSDMAEEEGEDSDYVRADVLGFELQGFWMDCEMSDMFPRF